MRSVAWSRIAPSLILILLWIAPQQLLIANQNASPPAAPLESTGKLCALSGHVTNSVTGEPLRKVFLKLLPVGVGAMWTEAEDRPPGIAPSKGGYSATSDAEGVFQFENVTPGRYNLSASRFGFLPTRYTGGSAAESAVVLTLVPNQQMTALHVPLTPQAVLSGRVTDDDGDPIVSSFIQVTAKKWSHGKLRFLPQATCAADDRGDFRCAGLPPGKYYVSAQARMDIQESPGSLATTKPRPKPIKTYYPGSPSLSNATLVEITPGQDVRELNIRLLSSQTFHVRGRVSGNRTSAYVTLTDREDSEAVFMGAQPSEVKPDGTFDVPNVTPGAYVASIIVMNERNVATMVHQNVDVRMADVNNVAFTVTDPVSLRGQISVDGTPPNGARVDFSNIQIGLVASGSSNPLGQVVSDYEVDPDGSFLLSKIPADLYTLVTPSFPGLYLKSVQYGQTEMLGHELDLTSGTSGDLTVIYRYGPAEISGMPKQPDGAQDQSTAAEQKIMLIPETLNADGSGIHFSRTDGEGKFKIGNLPPGHYRIYAFEQVNFEEIQNPELLKLISDKGISVELKEGEKRQTEPPLILAKDLNQILAQSGLAQ